MDDKTEKTRKSRAIIDETLSDGSLEEGGSVVDENEGTPGIVVVDQGNEEAGEGVGNASTVFPAELRRRRRHSFERISDNPLWIAKLHYFEEARHERIKREKTGGLLLAGIFTTFDHLRGIRQDIKFGQLSAENRQRREQNVGIISIYDREKMNCAFEIPPPTVWGGGVDGTGGTNDKTAELDYNIYRDSTSITPWFVYVLLMTCSVIFVVSFWVNSWQVEPLSNNPMIGFSYDTMVAMGSLDAHLIVNEGQAYRLVTPWFIHSGILHYLSNVISLGIFALPLEKSHGFFVIATIFFISSYGGSLGSALMLQSSVGMSGGIFGLIGANVVDLWVNAGLMFDHTLIMGKPQSRCLVFSSIVFEVIMLFLLGLTPLVDNYSHFAGFFFGILAGVAVLQPIDTRYGMISSSMYFWVYPLLFSRFALWLRVNRNPTRLRLGILHN